MKYFQLASQPGYAGLPAGGIAAFAILLFSACLVMLVEPSSKSGNPYYCLNQDDPSSSATVYIDNKLSQIAEQKASEVLVGTDSFVREQIDKRKTASVPTISASFYELQRAYLSPLCFVSEFANVGLNEIVLEADSEHILKLGKAEYREKLSRILETSSTRLAVLPGVATEMPRAADLPMIEATIHELRQRYGSSGLEIASTQGKEAKEYQSRFGSASDVVGYAWPFSVQTGDDLTIRVSAHMSATESVRISGARIKGLTRDFETSIDFESKSVARYDCEAPSSEGCDYPDSLKISTADLLPDMYEIVLLDGNEERSVPIIALVREDLASEELPRTAIVLPYYTWHAYNRFGGYNFYSRIKGNNRISLKRPLQNGDGNTPQTAAATARFFRENGRDFAMLTDHDLESMDFSRQKFDLLILSYHDEYWTHWRRNAVERYLNNGGRYLIIGGNTAWIQIVEEGNALITNKSNKVDFSNFSYTRRVGKFEGAGIRLPQEELIGLNYSGFRYPVKRRFPTFE